MAKDKSLSKEERKAAKKAAKEVKVETNGVTKVKSDKKDKKEKKAKKEAVVEKIIDKLEKTEKSEDTNMEGVGKDGEVVSEDEVENKEKPARPIGALVPFANPLADDKVGKKVFKSVKKGIIWSRICMCDCANITASAAAQRTLKRGVKEVVKALRKSPNTLPGSESLPLGVVILAADISPMDVISHIPVLCEDHNVPYIYVTSRAELGMAGQTKRPTSVVMVSREAAKKAVEKKEGDEEWIETYKGLVKVVEREGKHVKI